MSMNKDKLIKNEQIARAQNKAGSSALIKFFGEKKKTIINKPIKFICECSDINCTEPVIVSIDEYRKLHKRNNQFLIVKGHRNPHVDRVVEKKGPAELVEKPDLKP